MRTAATALVLSALACPFAHSAETRLSIDSAWGPNPIQKVGQIQVTPRNQGSVYTVDASAVLNVVPSRLMAVALDFDRQKSLGMPEVAESHVVSRDGDELVAWMHMSSTGVDSKHYLELRTLRGLSPSSALGLQWELAHNPGSWPYDDSPAFGSLEGSLYVLPLGSGDTDEKQATYVRYFTRAEVQSLLPSWFISSFVRGHLAADIQQGLKIMAQQAQ